MKLVKTLLFLIMLIGGTFWILSYSYEPNLSSNIKIDPRVYQAPRQTPTKAHRFEAKKGNFTYKITPVFNYSMDALVISHGDGWYIDEDPLNTDDICVVWGKTNTKPEIFSKIRSKNISWACFPRAQGEDRRVYAAMKPTELSNNHILPASDKIEQKLDTLKRGDQIHLKGYLVNYEAENTIGEKHLRATSTARDDVDETGFYKCEVIYVTDFDVITPYQTFTDTAYIYAPYATLGSFGLLFILFLAVMIRDSRSARPFKIKSDRYDSAQSLEQIKAEIEQKLRDRGRP